MENIKKKSINQRACRFTSLLMLAFWIFWLTGNGHAESADPWKSFRVFQNPVQKAAEFTLPNLEGKEVSLSSLHGKVVFMNFWATWCFACKAEIASMDRLYQKYKDKGFVFLGINYLEPEKRVLKFMQELGVTFPILLNSKGSLSQNYPIMGIPTTYLVDKKGNLRGTLLGYRDWDNPDAEAIVLDLLRE